MGNPPQSVADGLVGEVVRRQLGVRRNLGELAPDQLFVLDLLVAQLLEERAHLGVVNWRSAATKNACAFSSARSAAPSASRAVMNARASS